MSSSAAPELPDAAADTTALVLAGGKSRRFGADKARHVVAGRPMVRRAYDAVRAATGGPVLVSVRAGQRRFDPLPDAARYVEDAAPNAGPLAGLVAGLRAADGNAWLLALACDLPFVTPEALRRLLDARAAGVEAVVAEAPEGPRQPLCACYRCEAVLPPAEAHLRDRRLAMRALLDGLATRTVAFEARALRNVNRPADLRDGANDVS